MSKRITLFSPFFHPEMISTGKYNTYLAKAMVRLGFSVEVVASYPLYPEWKPRKIDKGLDGIKVYRGGLFPYSKKMIFRRLQLESWFTIHSIRHVFQKPQGDIIVAVFPPMLFYIALKYMLTKSTKKVGIVHDIQGVMAAVSRSPLNGFVLALIRFFEKMAFKGCDKLIFVSKSMAQRAIECYKLEPGKVFFAYPFVNIMKVKTNKLDKVFNRDKCHIVYSGAIGEKQNPHKLLELFNEVVDNRKDTICHIFSSGPLFEELKNSPHSKNDNILFHDLVPEKNLYELYLRSDVQIIPQKPGTSEGAIPSKLPNILAAGTPVFLIGDSHSDLADLIRKSGIGFCSESWQTNKVGKYLSKFLEENSAKSHKDRQRDVEIFIREHFGIERLLKLVTS